MRRSFALAMVLSALFAAQVFAIGESRMTGTVVDSEGNPIPNAKIDVIATEARTFHQTFNANKQGEFTVFLLDGTIKYKFVVSADGYVPYEETIKLKLLPEKNEREFKLNKQGEAAPGAEAQQAAPDPAVLAYNEGVALLQSGDDAGAIAKFEESVAKNPDLAAGYIALAKMYAKTKNWPKAIQNGEKALTYDADQPDLNALLADAYAATGNKAKSEEYRKKAPANPAALFNEAARAINAGDDKKAEPLLKQAIAADQEFAQAYYELGMVYARMSKNAEARKNLQKYLELEPSGKDASTAKEMLKYLN